MHINTLSPPSYLIHIVYALVLQIYILADTFFDIATYIYALCSLRHPFYRCRTYTAYNIGQRIHRNTEYVFFLILYTSTLSGTLFLHIYYANISICINKTIRYPLPPLLLNMLIKAVCSHTYTGQFSFFTYTHTLSPVPYMDTV